MKTLVKSLAVIFCVCALTACNFNSPKRLTNKGIDNFIDGRVDIAISYYNKALESNPDYVPALMNLALAYDNLKDYKQAVATYQKVVQLQPENALAYNNMASAETAISKFDVALLHVNKAISLDEKYDSAYVNRGTIYFNMGEHKKAAADYEKAINLETKRPIAYYNRGVLYQLEGNIKKAHEFYDKATGLNRYYLPAVYAKAEYAFSKQDWEEAANLYARAAFVKADWEYMYKQAYAEFKLGNDLEAYQLLETAASINPKSNLVYALQGDVLMAQTFYEQAFNSYKKARALATDKASATEYDLKIKEAVRLGAEKMKALEEADKQELENNEEPAQK